MPGARPIGSPQLGGAALARRWYDTAAERAPWLYRSEIAGVAAAVIGLAALLAAILWLGQRQEPAPPPPTPIEITMADETAVQAAAEPSRQAPAQAEASEQGPGQQAAPAPVVQPEQQPAPPQPPAPVPAPPSRPAPAQRTPPRPAPEARPPPRPAPEAPAPRPVPRAQPRPKPTPAMPPAAPPRRAATPPAARPAPAAPARTAQPAARPANGASPGAAATRARASRLGSEIRLGQNDRLAPANAPAAQAQMTGPALQNIVSMIQRQVQPCANRQINPGPGASDIRVVLNLRLARDGSLIGQPRVAGHSGVDDDNRIYVTPVDRAAVAAFVGCAPLRGLPPELYDVPGGWSNVTLRYKLPG